MYDDSFTTKEVEEAMKNGRAQGHDKIIREIIKKMGTAGKDILKQIFNKVWAEKRCLKIGRRELYFLSTRKETSKSAKATEE